jgi:hypothetical protein
MELTEKHIIYTDFVCGEGLSGLGINLHCLSLLNVVQWSLEFCDIDAQDFDLPGLYILILLCLPCVTGQEKFGMRPSGWQVIFSPTLLLLHRLL